MHFSYHEHTPEPLPVRIKYRYRRPKGHRPSMLKYYHKRFDLLELARHHALVPYLAPGTWYAWIRYTSIYSVDCYLVLMHLLLKGSLSITWYTLVSHIQAAPRLFFHTPN